MSKLTMPVAAQSNPAPIAGFLIRIGVVALLVALFGIFSARAPGDWVNLLGPAFFLLAFLAAIEALVRLHRGDAFGPAMVRALNQIGASLMLGAWAVIIAQPSLIFLIGNGFTEMRGLRFNYDLENLTLALVGFVFILLARRGRKLQSTLDEFI